MTRCTQPDCSGTVGEDGFCDECGMAPPNGAEPTGAQPTGAPAPEVPETPGSGASVPPVTIPGSPQPRAGSQPSGPLGSTGSGASSGGRTLWRGSQTSGGTGGSARRGMLGAGLVEVPPVPYRDPTSAIMQKPKVPENRRFCSRCDEPVGRSRDGRPGRTEGFCRKCGHPFSFTPKLMTGDLVGGQYEVLGCLAHGGLGWIYLARDHNVSGRWVVLKGLLDTGDADSLAAATAERAFLAEVEHPNIVKIYNFVRHGDSGYIVMEYVGGQSLKDILLERRKQEGDEAALPLPQVLAYGLEVLRALGYLHGVGLLYCDFKPDNAIQSEEQLKLIDLGGVRRAFDVDSPIFGTPGYQAPEISDQGPSVTSDLYTVGRTLAVLSFPFRGYTKRHLRSLPPRDEVPLLKRHESYYRLLRRATHPDPAARFQSAAEMAEQLTGVLREVLAAEDGRPRQAVSTLFGPERDAAGTEIADIGPAGANGGGVASTTVQAIAGGPGVLAPLDPAEAVAALPATRVMPDDPGAAFLAGLTSRDRDSVALALEGARVQSPEIDLALTRVRIEQGQLEAASHLLGRMGGRYPDDWRVDWVGGTWNLASGKWAAAGRVFDLLYDLMPGETAPKLALGFCAECDGRWADAARFYETVWRTDPTYVSAAFGLARVRLATGDRAGAERVLDSVPPVSSHYLAAQLAAVVTAVRGRRAEELNGDVVAGAARRLEGLRLDTERYARFAAEVLEAALTWVRTAPNGTPRGTVLGISLQEFRLRRGLEETYRTLAKLAGRAEDRHALVRRANAVRPMTLL